MAITGTEWLILGAIVLLVVMFKPNAITDLARSVGRTVNEFKKGRMEPEDSEKRELLVDTAERLGIRTEGKSVSKISEEILARAGRDQH